MSTSHNYVLEELALETAADWSVSHGRHFRANIIIWGMYKHYSALNIRTILADANFENLACGEMCWEGDHLCVVLTVNDSKAIDKSLVSELSVKLRKIGCRQWRSYLQMRGVLFAKKGTFPHPHLEIAMLASRSLNEARGRLLAN